MNRRRFQQLSHWGAFTAVAENGRLVACEPFARDPAPSPMLEAMPAMVHSAARIARPAIRDSWFRAYKRGYSSATARSSERRGSEGFTELSWDEALGVVAEELSRVRAKHGDASIFGGSYGWSSAGRFHHARTQVRRFLFSGGGCTDQVSNYSWGAAQFILPHVIGTYQPVTGDVTDWNSVLSHTRLLIAFGGFPLRNGQITSGGAGEHTMEAWLRAARDRGIDMIVISPSRADAPPFLGARWIAIRPNTDTAFMLGVAHTLLALDRHDAEFLEKYCTGFQAFRAYLSGETDGIEKNARWAASICGIADDSIRALALQASGARTLFTMTWALQRAHHGEQPYWMMIALAAMLGQIGLPGGGFAFGHGSINGVGNPRADLPVPEIEVGGNRAASAIPVSRLSDMLEHPGCTYEFNGDQRTYPDIRLVYWAGGNPFHHHQDLNRLSRVWSRPETIVVHDSWWTATARRADIVLPATTTLERNDIGASSSDRYVFAMQRAIQPVGASRDDFNIFSDLAQIGGYADLYTEGRSEGQWLRAIWRTMQTRCLSQGVQLPEFEEFWERGWIELPVRTRDYVLFEEFRADPTAHPLKTPSGKIELYSATIAGFHYSDCPPHPSWLEPAEWLGSQTAREFPLHLITIQPPDRDRKSVV